MTEPRDQQWRQWRVPWLTTPYLIFTSQELEKAEAQQSFPHLKRPLSKLVQYSDKSLKDVGRYKSIGTSSKPFGLAGYASNSLRGCCGTESILLDWSMGKRILIRGDPGRSRVNMLARVQVVVGISDEEWPCVRQGRGWSDRLSICMQAHPINSSIHIGIPIISTITNSYYTYWRSDVTTRGPLWNNQL